LAEEDAVLHKLVRYFLQGLMFVVPAAVTIYVVYFIFRIVDGWLNLEALVNRPVPGAGFLLTLLLITLAGFLATNIATRWLFSSLDQIFTRLPLVKLFYTSMRDLVEAFVGDKKRFNRPVLVSLGDGSGLALPGFLTRADLTGLGLSEHVAVYFPQSYNFAGNVLVVPRQRVTPLEVDSTTAMTFIVSGGVAGDFTAARELAAENG
jgi:uncharacterized membrane protein